MAQGTPSQIGRYKVEEEIGRGGFGRVYRAIDPTVNRAVAVKVLTESNKELLSRFRNEATLAGNLRHENIVTVYEFGEHDGMPFLAMEYLEGETLQQIISTQKPLSLLQKCNIMSQAAEGLNCAHNSGIVHRDVKPANIMVLPDGRVKIMDFGIAKLVRDVDSTRLTQEGLLIGTLLYMSPEQLRGLAQVDSLCDIFAYGVIYYELLVGKHPFAGPNSQSILYNLSFVDPTPIKDFLPDFPDTLQTVISRTLAKDRDFRYSSLKDVQFDVEPIRIELQQQRAADLLSQAQELIAKQEVEPAQTLILEVLRLDPSNRIARSLWETLQQQSQKRALRQRVEAMLNVAEEHLTKRRFSEAVQGFETALRADRDNEYIQIRLEHSRAQLDHNKKVNALLTEARKQFTEQNLTEASSTISDALRHDPEHPEAMELFRTVQHALERRQREHRIQEAIEQASALMSANAFDEAIAALDALGKDSETSKVKVFRGVVQNAQKEHERKQRLRAGMAAASDLLHDRQFREAIDRLETLGKEFPDNTEVVSLLSYARTELEAEVRKKATDEAAEEAERMVGASDFDGALTILDAALKTYPDHLRLSSARSYALSAKADWGRQLTRDKAVQTALEHSGRLFDQGQYDSAIQVVDQGLTECPGEPALIHQRDELFGAKRALEQLLKESRESAADHDFEKAAAILERGMATYAGARELQLGLESVRAAGQAWQREITIRDAIDKAAHLASGRHFPEALRTINSALKQFQNDPALIESKRQIEDAFAQDQWREAVGKAAGEAAAMLDQGRLDEALQLLRAASARYPGESELPALLERANAALEARARQEEHDKAVRQLDLETGELARNRRFEPALKKVADLMLRYPGDAALTELQDRLEAASRQDKLAREIEQKAARVRGLIDGEQLEEAVRSLDELRGQHPREAVFESLLAAAKTQMEARRLRSEAVREAEELIRKQRFENAITLLQEALVQLPGDAVLTKLRDQTGARLHEIRQREAAVHATLESCRSLAQQNRFDEALQSVNATLQKYNEEPQLRALSNEMRMRAGLVNAHALMARSRPAEALRTIEATASDYLEWPEVAAAKRQAEEQLAAQERAAALERHAQTVREKANTGDLDGSLRLVDEGLAKWPDAESLSQLREKVLSALTARQRQRKVEEAVRRCQQLEQQGQLDAALQAVQKSLEEFGTEPALLNVRKQIEAGLLERKRRERRDRDLAEVKQIATSIPQVSSLSQVEQLIRSVREVVAQYPGDVEVGTAGAGALNHLSDVEGARRALDAFDTGAALSICDRYASAHPGHILFGHLRAEAELQQKQAFVDDLRRRAESEADLNKRAGLLDHGLARYPDDEWIQNELRLTRDQLSRLNSALEKARRAEDAKHWDEAVEQWNLVGTIHAGYPSLKAEIDRVRRMREAARAEEIASRARAIGTEMKAGNLEKAEQLLREVQTATPGAEVFTELRRQLNEIFEKRNRARELVSQARQALKTDWRRADALLAEVSSLASGFTVPDDLVNAIAKRRQEAAVSEAVTEVERHRQSGGLRAAEASIAQAVAALGPDPRLTKLRDAVAAEIRRRRQALKEELRRLGTAIASESDPAVLQSLLQRWSLTAEEERTDPEIGGAAADAVESIKARLKQLRWEQLRNKVVSHGGIIAAVAGALVLAVGGWYAVTGILHSRHTASLAIKSGPGVLIRVGNQECTMPDCKLDLKPGTYTLNATKAGYQEITKRLTVTANQNQVDVPVELAPLPQLVVVNTNFETGEVLLDGRQVTGGVSNGQFSMTGLEPGQHTMRVRTSGAEFQMKWLSAVGRRPELVGPIVAANLATTVVANIGVDAAIACNCGAETVTVNGTEAGQTSQSAGELTRISKVSAGVQRIGVGAHSMALDVRPNPAINVFLTTDRNVGTLVVTTGQQDVKVYLDNRYYRQTGPNGMVRMPLDSATYSIRVEKEGFSTLPAQSIQVKKGEEKSVTFALTPLPARLEIAGAQPGAQVKIDGAGAGQVGTNGSFRAENVAGGRHSIELISEGYNLIRLDEQFSNGKTTRLTGAAVTMSKINRPTPPPQTTPPVSPSPAQLEAQEWERVKNRGPEELERFTQNYPGSQHAEEARTRAATLRQQTQRNADEATWQAVDKGRKTALQEFVSGHANNPHAAEARALIAQLEKQEADAAAALTAQRAKERSDQEQAGAALQQEGIRRTLAAYESAYNQMDLKGLRAVWTTIPEDIAQTVGKQFQFAKTVKLGLRPLGPAAITGDSATVNCARSLSLLPKDSRREIANNDRVRVTLSRSGSGWTIQKVEAY